MGIQGLLPILKSIHRPTELKRFAGETLGVDAYGWLHRGAIGCAIELAQNKPTRRYVDFVMHRVRMAKHFGVTPYLVFDGDYLPSKALTEDSRAKRREENAKSGLELLKAGKPTQAYADLQKAIDVTPEMARTLIEELKKAHIPYVVAPYEADAQLVYLERQGIISGIISEDSDMLVYGAKRLLTKLDKHGQCIEINRRDFCACREISLTGWTDADFRQMAILSGCDYLDRVQSLGLKTAYRLLRKHKSPEKVIRMLQFEGNHPIPPNYLTLFRQAEFTFLYQRVYCPKLQQQVFLTSPPSDVNVDDMPYIGAYVEPAMARSIALGDVNPITKQPIQLEPLPDARKRAASVARRTVSQPANSKSPTGKPIESYFKGHRRIPLGEMDANCFSVDPQRVAAMTENGERAIVFPLPRPYVEESAEQSPRPRSYLHRSSTSASPRVLRRSMEPISSLLHNEGTALGSSRRRTTGPIGGARDVGTGSVSGQSGRPPKKARLCDDALVELGSNKERSKFFPGGGGRKSIAKKTDGYLLSDDSIEEALMDLPDVDGWHTTTERRKEVMVFQEDSQTLEQDISKDSDRCVIGTETVTSVSVTETATSKTPRNPTSAISRFAFSQDTALSTSSNNRRFSYNRPTPASSVQSSTTRSTPASSVSSMTAPSVAKSTPATPLMTPLQRMGAQALNRRTALTPTFVAPRPRPSKRLSLGKANLDSIPVNPSFVPLPPMDLEEVEALHRPVGSEDMLVPESEGEDVEDCTEHAGKNGRERRGKVDLSRFLFA